MTFELRLRTFWQAARGAAARLNQRLAESDSASDMVFQTRLAPVKTQTRNARPAPSGLDGQQEGMPRRRS